ncbi:hypothetical protein SB767_30865, partial [Bacillus sp. SIMBA_069]
MTVLDRPMTHPPAEESVQTAPAPDRRRPNRRGRRALDRLSLWVPLALFLLFTLVPMYWMVLFAFR